MADWIHDTSLLQRRPLFLSTQAPVAAAVALLFGVVWLVGIEVDNSGWLALGGLVIAFATVLAVVVPWQRLPAKAHGLLAVADFVGIAIIAVALYGSFDVVAVLAVLPAIWLGAACGIAGVAVATILTFAVSIVPLLTTPGERTSVEWASALVLPAVLGVLPTVGLIISRTVRRSLAARDAAVVEAERIGAIMQSFFDEVDVGMMFLDEVGEVVLLNQSMLDYGRLGRYGEKSGGGTRVFGADQVTRLPVEDQPLARVRRGETVDDFQYWVGPRGGQRALSATGREVLRPDGRAAGSILVVQDVTDMMRANRAREDALATLAHELRTPLTSIVGYTDLLLMDALPDAASARVEVIARNADHLLTLVSTFLDGLHRDVEVERERLHLRALVDDAVDVLRATPGFIERDLHVDVDHDLSVLGDRQALSAVLNNLLSNAVKFSSDCDRVTIAGDEDERWVSLVVRNTGSQIDRDDLERIFDRFYRGRNAQRGAVAGTGIGLSISRNIATAHGGTLTAEDIDAGASFRLCLPRD